MSDIFPCLGIAGSLIVIVGLFAFLRYRNYRETINLAEKGLPLPEHKTRKGLLRWGILLTMLGVVLSLALYPIGFATGYTYPLQLGPWMLGGFVPLFLGLSLILAHFLFQKD